MLVNVFGYTSAQGGDKNKALSMARAITVANLIKDKLSEHNVIVYYSGDMQGSALSFDYGEGFNKDGKEREYISSFATTVATTNEQATNTFNNRKGNFDSIKVQYNTAREKCNTEAKDKGVDVKQTLAKIDELNRKIMGLQASATMFYTNDEQISELRTQVKELTDRLPSECTSLKDLQQQYLQASVGTAIVYLNVIGKGQDPVSLAKSTNNNDDEYKRIEVKVSEVR